MGWSYDFAVARLEGYDPAVVGTEGDDTITIAPGMQTGTLKVTVHGGVTDDVTDNVYPAGLMLIEGRGGNDTFIVTAALPAGMILAGQDGSDTYDITFGNLAGLVTVADTGTPGTDQLIARGTAGNDYIFKNDTQVTLGNPVQQTISYYGMDSLTIHGGAGNDTIVDPGTNTHIFGDAGNDTIIINATSGNGVTVDGGAGSDSYVLGGTLAGPVTITDTGTSGTDSVTLVGTPGDDAIVQTASGFTLNGIAILVTGLESATVDGGGGTGDTFTIVGTPSVATTVQGVSDAVIQGTAGNDTIVITPVGNTGQNTVVARCAA